MTHQFDLATRQVLFKRFRHDGKTCNRCGKPVTPECGWEYQYMAAIKDIS